MATDKEFIVNKKFIIVFVVIQVVITGFIVYALISPKSVTIEVRQKENSYFIDKPLEITLPNTSY